MKQYRVILHKEIVIEAENEQQAKLEAVAEINYRLTAEYASRVESLHDYIVKVEEE